MLSCMAMHALSRGLLGGVRSQGIPVSLSDALGSRCMLSLAAIQCQVDQPTSLLGRQYSSVPSYPGTAKIRDFAIIGKGYSPRCSRRLRLCSIIVLPMGGGRAPRR